MASLFLFAVTSQAEEAIVGTKLEQNQQTDKSDCETVAMNCKNQGDISQQWINRNSVDSQRGSDANINDEQINLNNIKNAEDIQPEEDLYKGDFR
jgi:hypothetical protein